MKKVLFIINPNSGTKQKDTIENYAKKILSKETFLLDFIYTTHAGHASEISKNEISNYDIICAVGGDGTIHEVAQNLIYSKTTLAIVPMGSGNGLARFLNIPLQAKKALDLIKKENSTEIDTILCNDEYFINMAGIGFDAHIGNVFDKTPNRGKLEYIRLIIKELKGFKPLTLSFKTEKENFTQSFFIASIANSSQWGINAHIAPSADIRDGFFELVFLKKFPLYKCIGIVWKLFNKKIHSSKYVELKKLESLTIENNKELLLHLDGEPRTFSTNIDFTIQKLSLKIII
jgi:diacylglycerol kinase (ATP)